MANRPRITLVDQKPSTVWLTKNGRRSTEKLLLEADGVSAMVNEDGTVSIELYTQSQSIILRLTADDTKSQVHIWKQWRDLR